ncbi:MAG: hypothetical protein GXP15_07990 [Gammaproteobacteria bacterium]|nr:hypothetical protein [Gammaproteobacteria bacterium]
MTLRASSLVKKMLAAAKSELGEKWPDVRIYAESEARKLAQTIVMIEKLKATGRISRKQADILFDMQKQTSRVVLLTVEGLGLLAAEAAVNAAVKSIRDTVNDAIGWRLV